MVRKTKGRRRLNVRRTRRRRRTGGQMPQPPTIIRFWMQGCGACKASEPEWTKFEEDGDDSIKKIKIERSAIPSEAPQWDSEVKAFPTYIVVVDGKKVAKEAGVDTDLGKLEEVAVKAASKKKNQHRD